MDIINTSYNEHRIAILLGNGTFQPAIYYNIGNKPEDVKAVDLNGDMLPDRVVASHGSNRISVLLSSSVVPTIASTPYDNFNSHYNRVNNQLYNYHNNTYDFD
ncbi:MAG: hypothetical protein MRQ09_03980 [Candidatus Midichloria sp.]|nr:hypothetical protein [Candidatus Midichloria sp.]